MENKLHIFLICPVRNATEEQKQRMAKYIAYVESLGAVIHYPERDTEQDDPTGGSMICKVNRRAIYDSDEVHIFWDSKSQGSLFDLGMAFALCKPIKIVNIDELERTDGKSFTNVVYNWSVIGPGKINDV